MLKLELLPEFWQRMIRACAPCALFLAFLSVPVVTQAFNPPANDHVLRFSEFRFALAPEDDRFILGNSFTMMGWFFWDEEPKEAVLMGQLTEIWPEPPLYAQVLQVRPGDRALQFNVSDGLEIQWATNGDPPPVGEWVHVACVLDSGRMRLYINGTEVDKVAFASSPLTDVARFSIGSGVNRDRNSNGSEFAGFISEVSVWSKGLGPAEIQDAATNGLSGNEDGLIAYWKLDDLPESFVGRDYSTNGLDLRLDQSGFNPFWVDSRPLQYPREAVENPYFEVLEYEWLGAPWLRPQTGADLYILDLDGDGFDDAILSEVDVQNYTEVPLKALRNQGDLSFTEITESKLGSVSVIVPRQGRVADFNADGVDDLFIIDTGPDVLPFPGHQNTLLLGNVDGRMSDVSRTHLPLLDDVNHGLDVGDIDGDGDIDLFAGQQPAPWFDSENGKPEVFINDGSGRFTLQRDRLPESEQLFAAIAISLLDADRDGFPDVFFSHGSMTNKIGDGRTPIVRLKNDGAGRFEFPGSGDVIDNEFFNLPGVEGIDLVSMDVNNDGYLDLIISYQIISYTGGGIWLFMNNTDGTFTKIEDAFPSSYFDVINSDWWIAYLRPGDFNGDGWIDVFAEGYSFGDFLFLNNGDNTFTNASSILTPKINLFGSVSNIIDVDNDGRLDILSVANGNIQVLRNVRDFATAAPITPVPTTPWLDSMPTLEAGEKLSWQETPTAALFDIEIATDQEFQNVVFQRSEYPGLSIAPTNLAEGTTHFWRIRGINTKGVGAWSAVFGFRVPLPDEPTIPRLQVEIGEKTEEITQLQTQLSERETAITQLEGQVAGLQSEVANKFSPSEFGDLRPGSTMIEVMDGNLTIELELEQSDNLLDWVPTGKSTSVTLPVPDSSVKWFRFANR